MTLNIGTLSLKSPYLAAPMCGISFLPYREICRRFGAGMAATQMLAAPALLHRDEKTARLMQMSERERPVTVQLLGHDATSLAEAAKIVEAAGADCVDINLGCPAKKIVGSGGGSALMQDVVKAADIFRAVRAAIRVPFTIKIRAGWNEQNRNFKEIARAAEQEGVDAVCMHARTKAEAYTGHADWALIRELKHAVKIPVIGNGDVRDFQDARAMLEETGCDGVMVGRASFEAPWIFKSMIDGAPYEPTLPEKRDLLVEQYHGMVEQFGERNGVVLMRKFVCAYTKGMSRGSLFRQAMLQKDTLADVLALVSDFFAYEVDEL